MNKSLLLRSSAALFVPLAASAIFPTAAAAQQITSSITGRVTNASGAPVAGAQVVVTDTRTGASQSMTTDATGTFNATGLTTGGPYTVTATGTGLQGQTAEGIQTTLQGPTQLTFTLDPVTTAANEKAIVVTASRVRATQLSVGPGTSFTQEVLQAAPTFDRDIRDIIKQDPRVSLDRQDVSSGGSGVDRISCLGGNDRGNTFTVDGIPQSDIYGLNDTGFSSRSSTPVPYDAVRETQVQFAPFDVQYGQFTGCAINVVTKSGSNKFHGGGFYEFTNNSLRGDKVGSRPVTAIGPDKRWGINLGGPIWRDKLFFFGAYEHQKAEQSQEDGPTGAGYSNEIPGVSVEQFNAIADVLRNTYKIDPGALVKTRPFTNERLFGRVDVQPIDGQRLELTYQRLKESTLKTDDFSTNNQVVAGLNNYNISGTNSKYYSARLYSNWTDRLSTQLSYARSRIIDLQDPVGGGEAQSGNPIPRIVVGVDNPGTSNDATVVAGPGFSRSANDLRTNLDQYKAIANYDAGDHKFKVGFELNRAKLFNLFVQQATGTLVFRNINDLKAGLLSPGSSTGAPTGSFVTGGTSAGAAINATPTGDINTAAADFTRSIYSAYAQDDWRVNDALKIVAGARVDWFSGGHPTLNPNFEKRYGFANDTGFEALDPVVLPRLGFTYNLPERGIIHRNRIQGGVGIFSGGDPIVWFGNAFQNTGQAFALGTTGTATCGGVNTQVSVLNNGQFTGIPACALTAAETSAAKGLGFGQAIDPNIKLPTVWRANIGYQADFVLGSGVWGEGWHLNLDYIYSQYKNPFNVVDLSQAPDIRRGLNGFTSDGRPIYQTIDTLAPGCTATLTSISPTPTYANLTPACFGGPAVKGVLPSVGNRGEYVLTNAGDYRSHVASIILQKNFHQGIFTPGGSSYFTFGYAYTNSHDRRNMYNSTAGSNFNVTAAFDRQNPDPARSYYESRHNVTFSGNFKEKFFGDLASSFGWTYVGRSGRPYSLTFTGSGLLNANQSSSTNGNLLYIPSGPNDPNVSPLSNPSAVAALAQFASSDSCAKKYLGRSIKRNTCSNNWYNDLDLRFSQELPGPGRLLGKPMGMNDKLTAYVVFNNFFNFINRNSNLQYRRDFGGRQQIADLATVTSGGVTYNGVDAQGRYIIGNVSQLVPNATTKITPYQNANFINVSGSVWQVKLGLSYDF